MRFCLCEIDKLSYIFATIEHSVDYQCVAFAFLPNAYFVQKKIAKCGVYTK